jgi:ABC-type amino acid transport system permease subunit
VITPATVCAVYIRYRNTPVIAQQLIIRYFSRPSKKRVITQPPMAVAILAVMNGSGVSIPTAFRSRWRAVSR